MTNENDNFGANDLYAAYLLYESGRRKGFGRGGASARRQTKFLYYFVLINLLRDALNRGGLNSDSSGITNAVISIFSDENDVMKLLEDISSGLIDSYMTELDENSVFKEPRLQDPEGINFDINGFLKWEQLGRNLDQTPRLQAQLHFTKMFMGMSQGGTPTARQLIIGKLANL